MDANSQHQYSGDRRKIGTTNNGINQHQLIHFVRNTTKYLKNKQTIASALGVSTRTLHRWGKDKDVRVSNLAYKNISRVYEIFEILDEALPEDGIYTWLNGYNRNLRGERPIDLLKDGNYEAVYRAAIHLRDNILF